MAYEQVVTSVIAPNIGERGLYVSDFGAKGDGTTDDTNAIQAALDQGGLVQLAEATYRVRGTLRYTVAGTRLVGVSPSTSTLFFANGDDDCIVCDDLNSCTLEDLKLTATGKTGGRFLHVTGGSYLFEANRIYWNNGWDGLDFNEVNSALCANSACGGGMDGDYAIRFTGSADFKSDVLTLRSIGIANSGGPSTFAGILWDSYAHTLELEDVRIVRPGYGLLVQRSTGSSSDATPSFLNATKLEIDFPAKEAIRLNYMVDAWINNLYASGGGTSQENGVHIADPCSSIRIMNARISGAGKHNVFIAGDNVIFTGNRVYRGGQLASDTYSGVYIDSTASNVVVSNNDIGHTSSETQKYGIEEISGSTRVKIDNNVINGNLTGQWLPVVDQNYDIGSTFKHVFRNADGAAIQGAIGGSVTNADNYLRLAGNVTSAPSIVAEGASTNIGIRLTPKGTGTLIFGTYTAGAATDSTGFITITDAGGTTRKLMVQA